MMSTSTDQNRSASPQPGPSTKQNCSASPQRGPSQHRPASPQPGCSMAADTTSGNNSL